MAGVVFVGGIHGSGKGYLLNQVKGQLSIELMYLSASDVLKWSEYSDNPKDKKVDSICVTQDLLVINLRSIIKADDKCVLDGHFVLLNKKGLIEKIPNKTFVDINPKALFIKISNENVIKDRLKERDGTDWDFELLQKMQELEVQYAKELAGELGVNFYIVKDGQEDYFCELIKKELYNG